MDWSHLSKHLLFHAALDAGANLQIRIWFSKETLPPAPPPQLTPSRNKDISSARAMKCL